MGLVSTTAIIKKSNKASDVGTMQSIIKNKIAGELNVKSIIEQDSKLEINGMSKPKVLSPMVKFKCDVFIKDNDEAFKIDLISQSGPNWIFILYVILGLVLGFVFNLFFFLAIYAVAMYFIQRSEPSDKLSASMKYIEAEYN